MARPRLEFDQGLFENLCSIQCTLEEIAFTMKLSEDTVERNCKRIYKMRYADIFKRLRSQGFVSLRRTLWKLGTEDEDKTVLLFLAKNYLGLSDQGEKPEKETKPSEVKIIFQSVEGTKKPEDFFDEKMNHSVEGNESDL